MSVALLSTCSEIAALELLTTKEILQVSPEIVANVYVVMPLISLQLQPLDVPRVDQRWHLRVCIVRVVAANTGEQFALLITIAPLTELPVLPVDKHCYNTLPTSVSKVGYTIVDIESHLLV